MKQYNLSDSQVFGHYEKDTYTVDDKDYHTSKADPGPYYMDQLHSALQEHSDEQNASLESNQITELKNIEYNPFYLNTVVPPQFVGAQQFASYVENSDGSYSFIERDEYRPVDPELLPNYGPNRNTEDYVKTIEFFQVETSKRYQKNSTTTFCNIYVSDVTAALGVPIPRWLNGEKMRATTILGWIQTSEAIEHGWHMVSAEEAQSKANLGIPTVAITPGHIGMIVPGEGRVDENGMFWPSSAQAGRLNFEDNTVDVGFEGAIKDGQTIYYFSNESHYEFVSPDMVSK
jgi:hypothetical protein